MLSSVFALILSCGISMVTTTSRSQKTIEKVQEKAVRIVSGLNRTNYQEKYGAGP
jgi:hypothetical protein